MSRSESGFDIRRIVVAIDNSSDAGTTLEAAAGLAARLHVELEGVYVQDINLVRLAGLPVGREIHFLTGKGHDFTVDALEAETRAQEFTARQAIAAAAARARVTYAFRIARGQVDVEVISAAGNGDLLILGTGSRSPGGRVRLGRTARAAAERGPGGRGGHQRGGQRRPLDSRHREPLARGQGPPRPHSPGRGRARSPVRPDLEAGYATRRRPARML
jgi:nucleotide-binding universal stress UspA family protein